MNDIVEDIIKDTNNSELSFCKFISANDSGATGGPCLYVDKDLELSHSGYSWFIENAEEKKDLTITELYKLEPEIENKTEIDKFIDNECNFNCGEEKDTVKKIAKKIIEITEENLKKNLAKLMREEGVVELIE